MGWLVPCDARPFTEQEAPCFARRTNGSNSPAAGSEKGFHGSQTTRLPAVRRSALILPAKPLLVFATLVFANIEGEKRAGSATSTPRGNYRTTGVLADTIHSTIK
jgi:hypothetical protein